MIHSCLPGAAGKAGEDEEKEEEEKWPKKSNLAGASELPGEAVTEFRERRRNEASHLK